MCPPISNGHIRGLHLAALPPYVVSGAAFWGGSMDRQMWANVCGLSLAAAVTVAACANTAAPPAQDRPNIIVILADDLGYGDLGVQGARDVSTPNIDRLAAGGVRMTDFYANHPTCAPSRAGLLLGKYQQRFGFYSNPARGAQASYGMPKSEMTLPERLKKVGYATAMVGKWHLGWSPENRPNARGFDSFYGFLEGAFAYTADAPSGGKNPLRNDLPTAMPEHTTEAFTKEAVDFIDQHKDKPFFIYASYNAVHAPLQTTQAYLDRVKDEPNPDRRKYLAMLMALDDGVGEIVKALDRNGLRRKTLIVFTSDNGGPTWQTTSSNGPLNGVKVTTLEGGIRVPTIFSWPGVVPEGRTSATVGIGMDITATALAAAKVKSDGLDGVDLMPYLKGQRTGDAHRQLFWASPQYSALREGHWKLVEAEGEFLLFDLKSDIGEHHDLAAAQPQRLHRMKAHFEAWSAAMSPPANWEPIGRNPANNGKYVKLVRDYVNGLPVDPRPLLFGGGPE